MLSHKLLDDVRGARQKAKEKRKIKAKELHSKKDKGGSSGVKGAGSRRIGYRMLDSSVSPPHPPSNAPSPLSGGHTDGNEILKIKKCLIVPQQIHFMNP